MFLDFGDFLGFWDFLGFFGIFWETFLQSYNSSLKVRFRLMRSEVGRRQGGSLGSPTRSGLHPSDRQDQYDCAPMWAERCEGWAEHRAGHMGVQGGHNASALPKSVGRLPGINL